MVAVPVRQRFTEVIDSEEGLRAILGQPSEMVIKKQMPRLDAHCRAFIALSPFMLLGTTDEAGNCDVSPRGDAPGFVLVLDEETIVIPDRPGNKRIDSLRNIVQTGKVGLLFVIPGVEETLRVNGRACIVRDADILARMEARGKVPTLGIGVEIDEAFLHCAKAFKRSSLWDAASWPERKALPTLGQMILDQVPLPGVTVEQMDASLEQSYKKNLY